MTYAFHLDTSACSGCKACQVACKDKNVLPVGVLWRRVYEISGGSWTRQGEAWNSTVFAYNLAISCNHCIHPKCAGVCPVDAFRVRPDGIVLIKAEKCIGCGYCSWACPYDAPQLDPIRGIMTKCDFCQDYLDAGLPPACVSACPLRCLNLVNADEPGVEEKGLVLWKMPAREHPFPLPKFSRTEPHLVIETHPAMEAAKQGAEVCNREEVDPHWKFKGTARELPLLLFTLLIQMALGSLWTLLLLHWTAAVDFSYSLSLLIPWFSVGGLVLLAMAASFFHLYKPVGAWRVLAHLKKSWISREILSILLFLLAWCLATLALLAAPAGVREFNLLALVTAVLGVGVLVCMVKVYQLRSVPAWNRNRTNLEFLFSVFLGVILMGTLLPQAVFSSTIAWKIMLLLSFTGAVFLSGGNLKEGYLSLGRLRLGLSLVGLLVSLLLLATLQAPGLIISSLFFILALAQEILGRWIFYARRTPGI